MLFNVNANMMCFMHSAANMWLRMWWKHEFDLRCAIYSPVVPHSLRYFTYLGGGITVVLWLSEEAWEWSTISLDLCPWGSVFTTAPMLENTHLCTMILTKQSSCISSHAFVTSIMLCSHQNAMTYGQNNLNTYVTQVGKNKAILKSLN